MADLHAPENGGATAASTVVVPGGESLVPFSGSKRQRRPSVRLGEIGDQPASDHRRHPKYFHRLQSSSKTRPLTNLATAGEPPPAAGDPSSAAGDDRVLLLADENHLDPLAVAGIRRGARDSKSRRGGAAAASRRIRSSWISRPDEAFESTDLKSSGGEDAGDDGFREDSESPSDLRGAGVAARVRVSESRDAGPAAAERVSDGSGDWNQRNGWCRSVEDGGGVRAWLHGLGLDRYAPVFEIHEVDEEVLPLLTLEDLKDMGINAVGSRRKMYCSIQKLRKSISRWV